MAGGGRRAARTRVKSSTDAEEDEPLRNPRINSKNRRHSSSLRIFNVRLEVVLGFCILSSLIIFFLIHSLVNTVEEVERPRVVTPFPAPKLMDLSMVHASFRCLFEFTCTFSKFGFFDRFLNWLCNSFKVIIERACIGEHIVLMFILEFVPGIFFFVIICLFEF